MNLTFAEDFTSTEVLDAQLIATPDSGLFWNRGVHPVLTVSNLLAFLPNVTFTFTAWDNTATYGVFETSRKRSDVVTHGGLTYLSLIASTGAAPKTPGTDTTYWLETNINSLRIRSFIWTVEDNFISALSLNRKLIENQYIYHVATDLLTLSNDYSGWVFEPKSSDYVKIKINQMSLQANTTDTVNVTVVNQGVVKETITLNPNNGLLEFEDVGYTISGKGIFYFVFPSQEVYSDSSFNDSLKYDGFVCYPVSGEGDTPEDASYTKGTTGNGLNFNVSVYLDSSTYVNNCKIDFSKFIQSQFEYDFLRMVVSNSNNQVDRDERNLRSPVNEQLLATESLDTSMLTIAKNYKEKKSEAIESINGTFDRFLHKSTAFIIKRKTV